MGISSIDVNNALSSCYFSNTKQNKTVTNTATTDVSDNYSESIETQKFKEIVSRYDITNISRNELDKMYKELYDNNLYHPTITATSECVVTNQILSQEELKKLNTVPEYTTVSGWTYSTNPDAKMNYYEGMKTQAAWQKENGNPKFQKLFDSIVEFVEKIKYFEKSRVGC